MHRLACISSALLCIHSSPFALQHAGRFRPSLYRQHFFWLSRANVLVAISLCVFLCMGGGGGRFRLRASVLSTSLSSRRICFHATESNHKQSQLSAAPKTRLLQGHTQRAQHSAQHPASIVRRLVAGRCLDGRLVSVSNHLAGRHIQFGFALLQIPARKRAFD